MPARTDQISEDLEKFKNKVIKKGSAQDEDKGAESDDLVISVLGSDFIGYALRLSPYAGVEDKTFSAWLKKFQDYVHAQSRPQTNRQKTGKLKFFLDGLQEKSMNANGRGKGGL